MTRYPNIETMNPVEAFPSVCPISGLPIRSEADWFYRNPQGNYETSFALIGRRILLVVAKGYIEEADMHQAVDLAERIKQAVLPPGTRYVGIENFIRARGGTLAARRRYLAYTNGLKGLLGSFVFGLPPFFRLSFNLSRRLGLHRHKVQVVNGYAAAIRAAVALAGEEPESCGTHIDGEGAHNRGDWPLAVSPDADRRLPQPLPLRPVSSDEVFRDEVNHLLEFLGGIDPERPGIRRRRMVDGGPTSPLEKVYAGIELMKRDMDHLVDEQRRTLQALSLRRDELRRKSAALERQNFDLRQLLQRNAEDSRELEVGVVRNAHCILKPLVQAMIQNRPTAEQTEGLNRLTAQVDELLDSFSPRLDSLRFNLTPQELHVARLIRAGFSSRQIAVRQRISPRTVTTHRTQIRKKLGIKGRRRNLRTRLLAIPDGKFEAEVPS